MISAIQEQSETRPTIWGLDTTQLHDRFWAARGVQVVRQGERCELVRDAELFLLTDASSLLVFRLGQLVETLSWLKPQLLFVRLHSNNDEGYRERIISDEEDRFVRFERVYGEASCRMGRVALTPSRALAEQWQRVTPGAAGWRELRHAVPSGERTTLSLEGLVFSRKDPSELMEFTRELVTVWRRPDATIRRVLSQGSSVWRDASADMELGVHFVGPVWVGAGRQLDAGASVVGPAVLWDDPKARPAAEAVDWGEIEPTDVLSRPIEPRALNQWQRAGKRTFDFLFAALALAMTLPFYPIVMLLIFLDDGRPFFFAHRRESRSGVEFPCLKFRTMRKDAEQIKQRLMEENQADGPQFFMDNDPRLTRVGRWLRKLNIDELPQFFNVLVGQMAVVGPRPSPYKENQFCPAWREARLSVRPGVTGLWQVRRSRETGRDFQEWIRYDIEYVENLSWRMDMYILAKTGMEMVGIGRK